MVFWGGNEPALGLSLPRGGQKVAPYPVALRTAPQLTFSWTPPVRSRKLKPWASRWAESCNGWNWFPVGSAQASTPWSPVWFPRGFRLPGAHAGINVKYGVVQTPYVGQLSVQSTDETSSK